MGRNLVSTGKEVQISLRQIEGLSVDNVASLTQITLQLFQNPVGHSSSSTTELVGTVFGENEFREAHLYQTKGAHYYWVICCRLVLCNFFQNTIEGADMAIAHAKGYDTAMVNCHCTLPFFSFHAGMSMLRRRPRTGRAPICRGGQATPQAYDQMVRRGQSQHTAL